MRIKYFMETKRKKRKTCAIIEEGEETLYDNIETEGFDIGFLNRGKKTKVLNSRFRVKLKLLWHQKWWWGLVSGVIIVVVGGYILYKLNGN